MELDDKVMDSGQTMDSVADDIVEDLHLLPEEPDASDAKEVPPVEGEPPEAAAAEPGAPSPATGESAPASGAVAPDPNDKAPDSWRKEAKEQWATVPAGIKAEIQKREADVFRYIEDVKAPVQLGKTIEKIFTPYLGMYEQYKVNPWDHVSNLIKGHHDLLFGTSEQKVAIIRQLAQDAGLNIEGGVVTPQAGAQDRYVQTLRTELDQLKAGMTGVTSTIQEARTNELAQQVAAFAERPENLHFDKVAPQMLDLIKRRVVNTLEEAYQTAVMANPETRALTIDSQVAAKAKATADAASARALAARKANGVNVRTTARRSTAQPTGNVDDTLANALADIHAREGTH